MDCNYVTLIVIRGHNKVFFQGRAFLDWVEYFDWQGGAISISNTNLKKNFTTEKNHSDQFRCLR